MESEGPESSAPERAQRSSDHKDLYGGSSTMPQRRQRLSTLELDAPLTCSFRVDAQDYGPFGVLDVSSHGLAFDGDGQIFPPGTGFANLSVRHANEVIWNGAATCAYQAGNRTGLRFTQGYLHLDTVRARALVRNRDLQNAIDRWRKEESVLPASWRADVLQLGNLFRLAKERLEYLAAHDLMGVAPNDPIEKATFEALHSEWAPLCNTKLDILHETSKFDEDTVEIARLFSERIFVPLFYGAPVMRRAIDKPLGYAGDYVQMIQYNTDDNEGTTLYDRFVHYAAKQYPFSKTIVSRQNELKSAIERAADAPGPVKIVALASGPVFEIRSFLSNVAELRNPMHFVLIDADPSALAYAQNEIDRILAARSDALPIKVSCVHVSVRQILQPESPAQAAFIGEMLGAANLIYSAGLFDYLPAKVATGFVAGLFKALAPGGELLIGNLRETPRSTWMLEFTMAWLLVYREESDMRAMASMIEKHAKQIIVEKDATERCLFLKAIKG